MNDQSHQSLHQLFEAQVRRTPTAIALQQNDIQISYAEVNQRANQLAYYLQAQGVGREQLVGLYIERSVDLIIGLLAVLKAGGAYVPLDPAYPPARLALIIDDAQLSFVLTRSAFMADLVALSVATLPSLLCVETLTASVASLPTTNPPSQTTPDNLAYVIYTSGSTGQPKGVLGLHRGMINVVTWLAQRYPFAATDRCCQKTALNFVDSLWEIFWPLLHGTPLVILSDPVVNDLLRFIQALSQYQITHLVVVPSLLGALLETPALQQQLPALHFWVSSGEALTIKLCQRFYAQLPQATLLNLYGSSEVSANASWYDTRAFDATATSIPIGRPLANTRLLILDEEQQPTPVGVVGELYVGGAGVARGYLNRPELTQQHFIHHPAGAGRLYKTGDRARFVVNQRSERLVEFMGRVDQQVKVRGIRIELAEIEETLLQHPQVRAAVVICTENGAGQAQLRAYFIARGDEPQPSLAGHLRHFLASQLPAYMIPVDVIGLATFPVTPNGKVDRLALAAWQPPSAPVTPPRTALESQVAALWQAVLGVTAVGVDETFFACGGDSLSLFRLQTQFAQTFAVKPTVLDLLRFPTVATQAVYLTDAPQEALVDLVIAPFTATDLAATIQCVCDSFVQGEILALTMQMTVADFLPFAQSVCHKAVVDGLSLIAKEQRTGVVVGFSICEDFMTPQEESVADFAPNQRPILAFLAAMDAQYKTDHPEVQAGDLLHILLGGSSPYYRGVGGLLQRATVALAQAHGFKGVISNDTGPLAQALSAADGFVEVLTVHYRPFRDEGRTPFQQLPADLCCKLMLKTV